MRSIAILMSTYNGQMYLSEQLDSIIRQDNSDWHLYIRDDGSTDETLKLISDYQKMYPDHISLLVDHDGNIGVIKSFEKLLSSIMADYYFFCDQDDKWKENKISTFITRMNYFSEEVPVLAFCGLIVTEKDLNPIKNSKRSFKSINRWEVLFENTKPGCSMAINNSLKELVLPFPESIVMHDHWFYQVCSYLGEIVEIKSQLQYYRQHVSNVIGVKKKSMFLRMLGYKDFEKIDSAISSFLQRLLDLSVRIEKNDPDCVKGEIQEIIDFVSSDYLVSLKIPIKYYLKYLNFFILIFILKIRYFFHKFLY